MFEGESGWLEIPDNRSGLPGRSRSKPRLGSILKTGTMAVRDLEGAQGEG